MKRLFFFYALLHIVLTLQSQGFSCTTDRELVDFENIAHTTVLFAFGQSNSANHGQASHLHGCHYEVYNYFRDSLFKARDPLLGATGTGASVWTRLGDKMIASGMAQAVTIVPIGVGGVEIAAWAEGGRHYGLLVETLGKLAERGVNIDYICWHQGESDNILKTSKEEYIRLFLNIRETFRKYGFKAPFIVAQASYHPDCLETGYGCSEEIRQAQAELAQHYDDIFSGPDTDNLNKLYQRHDGIHFSYLGQEAHAEMWLKTIAEVKR